MSAKIQEMVDTVSFQFLWEVLKFCYCFKWSLHIFENYF